MSENEDLKSKAKTTSLPKDVTQKLVEILANLEHEQWMKWAITLLEKETLSTQRKDRWIVLFCPYEDLPEEYKEFDREWARKSVDAIQAFLVEVLSERKSFEALLKAKDDQIEIFKITANQQIDKAIDLKGQLEAKNKDVAFLKWNVEKWNARWKELYGKLEAISQILNEIEKTKQIHDCVGTVSFKLGLLAKLKQEVSSQENSEKP